MKNVSILGLIANILIHINVLTAEKKLTLLKNFKMKLIGMEFLNIKNCQKNLLKSFRIKLDGIEFL